MKKVFGSMFLAIIVSLVLSMSLCVQAQVTADTALMMRVNANSYVIAQQAPYIYVDTLIVGAGNRTFTGKTICEIRTVKKGEIMIDTPTETGVILFANAYDIFRIRVTKVYYTGTSDSLRTGSLSVFGFPNAQ